jgi:shikimate kinase
VLVDRVGHEGHRPLLDDDPLGTLRRLTEEREPLYAEVATTTIDVADRRIEDSLQLVLDALARCEAG